mmetsp:Transcript_23136/g.75433  ORF Transcript_23136/g.75433 Transcript_23136/m.75433 type:complete len:243 (-) Transcript_23136:341-1069(-)
MGGRRFGAGFASERRTRPSVPGIAICPSSAVLGVTPPMRTALRGLPQRMISRRCGAGRSGERWLSCSIAFEARSRTWSAGKGGCSLAAARVLGAALMRFAGSWSRRRRGSAASAPSALTRSGGFCAPSASVSSLANAPAGKCSAAASAPMQLHVRSRFSRLGRGASAASASASSELYERSSDLSVAKAPGGTVTAWRLLHGRRRSTGAGRRASAARSGMRLSPRSSIRNSVKWKRSSTSTSE